MAGKGKRKGNAEIGNRERRLGKTRVGRKRNRERRGTGREEKRSKKEKWE